MRRALPDDVRRSADAAICRHLQQWLAGRKPGVLALWWPLAGEPDLRDYFDALSAQGWNLALPRVVSPDAPLEFGRVGAVPQGRGELEAGLPGPGHDDAGSGAHALAPASTRPLWATPGRQRAPSDIR